MHDTALKLGRAFFDTYLNSTDLRVLDVGSCDVNGSLREYAPKDWIYIGADLQAGPGVDLVIKPGEPLPFHDGSFDAIVATSIFEHDPFFWETFTDLARLLKPGGFLYVNVPSNGTFHRYPIDCWRFYPEAGGALCAWAERRGIHVSLIETFIADRLSDIWNDFVGVFARKPIEHSPTQFIHESFPCRNVITVKAEGILNEMSFTEDMDKIATIEPIKREMAQLNVSLTEISEVCSSTIAQLSPYISTPVLKGVVDHLTREVAAGWAFAPNCIVDRAIVEVRLNGEQLAVGPAANSRSDLLSLGVGSDTFGFCFHLSLSQDVTGVLVVNAHLRGVKIELARTMLEARQPPVDTCDDDCILSHSYDDVCS